MESAPNDQVVITDLQETQIGVTRAVGFVDGTPLVVVVIPNVNQDGLDLIALESHHRCMLARSEQYIPRSVLREELAGGDEGLARVIDVFLTKLVRAKQIQRAADYVAANKAAVAGKKQA